MFVSRKIKLNVEEQDVNVFTAIDDVDTCKHI
jgi:hypothetical protein